MAAARQPRDRRATSSSQTGPESYVKLMLDAQDLTFFPVLKTSSIIFEDVSNEHLLDRVDRLSRQLTDESKKLEALVESKLPTKGSKS